MEKKVHGSYVDGAYVQQEDTVVVKVIRTKRPKTVDSKDKK
jgi:hypothetical protein